MKIINDDDVGRRRNNNKSNDNNNAGRNENDETNKLVVKDEMYLACSCLREGSEVLGAVLKELKQHTRGLIYEEKQLT